MAKYVYKRYNVILTGTEAQNWSYNRLYIIDAARRPLVTAETYGTGYSFNSQTGFSLTGTIRIRQPGEYPVVNSYVLVPFSYGSWALYRILSETGAYDGITYHRSDSKGASLDPSRGTFIDEVVAEDGTYPDDGCIWGVFDYWYVKDRLAPPDLHMKIGGSMKAWQKGWVKIDGQLREVESISVKIDGVLREA